MRSACHGSAAERAQRIVGAGTAGRKEWRFTVEYMIRGGFGPVEEGGEGAVEGLQPRQAGGDNLAGWEDARAGTDSVGEQGLQGERSLRSPGGDGRDQEEVKEGEDKRAVGGGEEGTPTFDTRKRLLEHLAAASARGHTGLPGSESSETEGGEDSRISARSRLEAVWRRRQGPQLGRGSRWGPDMGGRQVKSRQDTAGGRYPREAAEAMARLVSGVEAEREAMAGQRGARKRKASMVSGGGHDGDETRP